jgi:hypothetical protein
MSMKKTVFLAVLVGICSANAFANSKNTTTLSACRVLSACTMQAGPYSEGSAKVRGSRYITDYPGSTCCQLGGKIKHKICKDGIESAGVVVSCR